MRLSCNQIFNFAQKTNLWKNGKLRRLCYFHLMNFKCFEHPEWIFKSPSIIWWNHFSVFYRNNYYIIQSDSKLHPKPKINLLQSIKYYCFWIDQFEMVFHHSFRHCLCIYQIGRVTKKYRKIFLIDYSVVTTQWTIYWHNYFCLCLWLTISIISFFYKLTHTFCWILSTFIKNGAEWYRKFYDFKIVIQKLSEFN